MHANSLLEGKLFINIISMTLKNFLSLAIFSTLTQISYSQTDKTVIASITYQVNLNKDGKMIVNDLCVLDVTKNQSYFYSKDLAERDIRFAEKIAAAKLTNTTASFNATDIPPRTGYKAYNQKKYDKKQSITIQLVGIQLLGYIKDPAIISNWKILDEKLVVSGLNGQKAQIVNGDLTVTAWFCKEIPIQDGPLAYLGLPGLITKISTSDGWEAELKEITNHKDINKQLNIVNYALVSESDIKKAIENAKANRGNGNMPSGLKIQKQN